jgi:hypothetical protein
MLLTVALALGAPAGAAEPDPGSEAPEACFARVYDAQHMAAHPSQNIKRIFFFRGHDPVSRPNEEPAPGAGASYSSFLATTVRADTAPKWVGTSCAPGPVGQKDRCGMACDRTLAYIARGPKGELLLTNLEDPYLEPDSEQTLSKAEYARQAFGKDDVDFRLDPQPVEVCKAEFGRIDPPDPALGPPLRERLKPDQPFCYGRDYDADHMKSHPGQLTTSIRIYRGAPEIASYASLQNSDQWPNNAEVIVSVTTRRDAKAATRSYACQGEGDQWTCSSPVECTEDERRLFLRRGANGGMLLVNPNSAAPIGNLCSPEGKGATKSDDKIFRVSQMPLSKCGL